MENIKQTNTVKDVKGKLTFEDKVVQKIVGIALESVDGLLAVDEGFFSNLAGKIVNTDNVASGVSVEVGEKQVAVDLGIVAQYGKNIKDIFEQIKKIVSKEVTTMTGLEVIEVNVNVVDVKTLEQHEADGVTLQDKVEEGTEGVKEFASDQAGKIKQMTNNGKKEVEKQLEPRVE